MALADPATMDTISSQHPSPPVVKSCKVCTALEKLFADDDVQIQLEKDEIYDQSCTQHDPLFCWIERNYYEYLDRLEKARNYHIVADTNYSFGTILFFRLSGGIPRLWVYSRMDPEWVDLGIVREWMERCSEEHESKRQNPNEKHVSPAWLIDTKDDCLVSGKDNRPFVALSYRWGSSAGQQIDKDTFEQLKNPSSLSRNNMFVTATVQDAIHTVRTIGGRYFWVDAICIAPENEEQLAEKLQLMGDIYASAKLTIVALDGDSSTGIVGLRSQSSLRSLSNIFPWQDGRSVRVRQLPSLSVQNEVVSKYFQRGWTLQEYALSQRRLIFEFNVLLNEYNNRQLTYPEDAFPAVNGLLTYLESFSFEYGSLFGLPRAVFDAALMWSYDIDADGIDVHTRFGLRRREPSERRHSVLPDTHLPSWSWIGWKGDRVRMLDTEAQFQWSGWYLDSGSGQLANSMRPSVITTPITDKQPIPRYPTVYNESSVISYDTELVPKVCSGKHGTMPKLGHDPFISCRMRRACFGDLRAHHHSKQVWMYTQLCLFDKQKRLCGWLQLPKDEDSLRFPGADCGRMPLAVRDTFRNPFPERNQLLELVANCRRKFPDSKFGEKWVHWEDFYGVLWVKWIERVAYRRACGYVQKELWEEQDLEDVDLILD
ncbi:heterokaryon incompatibility protein-domain-containing protein [Fusarium sp. MPI-SDFR-AT-0072]|nr:heterokaryon incompatibility protein-domain-containing protein [Fusarium sp. MPI-SDFR-AT-0072]